MKETRTKILLVVILLAAGLFITGTAEAKAKKTYVTGTTEVTPSGEIEPLEHWEDDDGILHIRGSVSEYEFEGDMEGIGRGLVNLNLDMSTGNGDESGYSTSELTWEGLSGTFAGLFEVKYTGWVGIGHGVYHGTGDFAGMKLFQDFTVDLSAGPPYEVITEGIILVPHGK
jgi:hypothetical protein